MTTELDFDIEPFITDESQRETAEKLLATFQEMAHNYRREKTLQGLEAAREQGRIGGRPRKLNEQQQQELLAMRPYTTILDLAVHFDISETTVCTYLKKARLKAC